MVQDRADQGDAFGAFATLKELRNRGASVHLGDVRPADADAERDAWAEHFRLIGEGSLGEGLVSDRVWDNIPLTLQWKLFGVMLRHLTSYMQL